MNKQTKSIFTITLIFSSIAMGMFVLGLIYAGNLNPPASPDSTMHTLDEIYNKAPSLPSPQDVEIITKSHIMGANDTWETIHTVTAGKTFYLMGFLYAQNYAVFISLDGGTTTHFWLHSLGDGTMSNITSPYPIASVPEGTEIKVKVTAGATTIQLTIWGYEKTN